MGTYVVLKGIFLDLVLFSLRTEVINRVLISMLKLQWQYTATLLEEQVTIRGEELSDDQWRAGDRQHHYLTSRELRATGERK